MQYIEGPEDKLLKLYDIIKRDKRHHGMIQIINTPINAREFENWSMAYSIASKTLLDQLSQANWLESDNNKSMGRTLLSKFWKSNTIQQSE